MKLSKNFYWHELVPRGIRKQDVLNVIDSRVLGVLEALRTRYGPITVNNWHWAGDREWSGFRTSDSPFYSPFSQHSFGRAADCILMDCDVTEVIDDIMSGDFYHRHLSALELGVPWLHFDVRARQDTSQIITFVG